MKEWSLCSSHSVLSDRTLANVLDAASSKNPFAARSRKHGLCSALQSPEALTTPSASTHFCLWSCIQGICCSSRNWLTTQFFLFPGKAFILLCCALESEHAQNCHGRRLLRAGLSGPQGGWAGRGRGRSQSWGQRGRVRVHLCGVTLGRSLVLTEPRSNYLSDQGSWKRCCRGLF